MTLWRKWQHVFRSQWLLRYEPSMLRLILRAAIAASLVVSAVSIPSCSRDKETRQEPASEEAALLKEFKGAYAEEAPPSTGIREFEMTAKPSVVSLFEGRDMEVWAFNEQVPGPTLRVKLGETVRLHFKNELPQPTTIHFHGVRVSNAMDGVPGVTQPPIQPGDEFTYEFTPKDAGTFWFHPHVRGSEQVERGLFGTLVVEDVPSLGFSQDVVWVLDDWRLTPDGSKIDPRFNTGGDLMHDGRWGGTVTVNSRLNHELLVKPGERIRLRLVNTSNARAYAPNFEGLDAKVIAVDGMYTERPLDPAGFVLAPGNRLDLDIRFSEQQRGELFAVVDQFSSRRTHQLASIRVDGEPVVTPDFDSPAQAKIPAWEGALFTPVHTEFVLNARRGGKLGIEWLINNRPYSDYKPTSLVSGQWHRLRFTNSSGRLHPMHIHGQFFKVLTRNGKPADEPYFRDTVLLRPRDVVDVGLVPLDVGEWMMHCHILEHAESGMMTVLSVRSSDSDSIRAHAVKP